MFKLKDNSKISIRVNHRNGYMGSGYPMVHADSFKIPNDKMDLAMRLLDLLKSDLEALEGLVDSPVAEQEEMPKMPDIPGTAGEGGAVETTSRNGETLYIKNPPSSDELIDGSGGGSPEPSTSNPIVTHYAPPPKPTTHRFSFTPENRN